MARFKNAVRFEKALLRYRSFGMRKSRCAPDEGRGKSSRGLTLLAELEADLTARRTEAADLKAALTVWVAGAGSRKTADGRRYEPRWWPEPEAARQRDGDRW